MSSIALVVSCLLYLQHWWIVTVLKLSVFARRCPLFSAMLVVFRCAQFTWVMRHRLVQLVVLIGGDIAYFNHCDDGIFDCVESLTKISEHSVLSSDACAMVFRRDIQQKHHGCITLYLTDSRFYQRCIMTAQWNSYWSHTLLNINGLRWLRWRRCFF